MLTTTERLPTRIRSALLEVAPDHAVVPFRFKTAAATSAAILREIETVARTLAEAVPAARVELEGYGSQTQKLGGKGLFGGGVRTAAQVSGRVVLPMAPKADFMARVTTVEELRGRLEAVDLHEGSLGVGECQFALIDRESHRVAAYAALRARADRLAEAYGLTVERLVTTGELSVEIAGPCAAFVSLDATLHFRAPPDMPG